ncbi:MAG: hypothetical protein H6701_06640 [Myxococcales bacterium]|nr:hypothetical protein [Myxococcales bacterium]
MGGGQGGAGGDDDDAGPGAGGAGGQGGQGGQGGMGGGSGECFGNFSLGSTFVVGDDVVGPCNQVPPTNCRTGFWIQFLDTEQCVCIPECSDFDPARRPGEACDNDGNFICQQIVSTNGNGNRASACVAREWNICTADGGAGGAGGQGGQGGSGGQGGEPECLGTGDECSFDSDCCSDSCSFGECE